MADEYYAEDFEFCCKGRVEKGTFYKTHTFNMVETHDIPVKTEYVCADCGKAIKLQECKR